MTQERITLEEQRAPGLPVVKRTALNQTFNGAVLKVETRDRLKRGDDGTMTPIIKPNGKHAQELVATCLVLPGTTAPAGLGDDEGVPEPGSMVRLILKGKSFGDWIEAKKSLTNGTVAVGDIVVQKTTVAQVYDAQGNASGPEIADQDAIDAARVKGRSVGIYGPITLREPKNGSEWLGKAIEAFRTLLVPVQSASSSADAADQEPPEDPDEPPF